LRQLKYITTGDALVNFNIAVNRRYKDKQGNPQEATSWVRCVAWRKQAELIAQYLKKGSHCLIEREIQTRTWEDDNGKRTVTEVLVNRIEFLSRNGAGAQNGGDGNSQSNTNRDLRRNQNTGRRDPDPGCDEDIDEDEIPF
jgi:single-strand DNA-binding protein